MVVALGLHPTKLDYRIFVKLHKWIRRHGSLRRRIFIRVGVFYWSLAQLAVPVLLRFGELIQRGLGHADMINVEPRIITRVNPRILWFPLPASTLFAILASDHQVGIRFRTPDARVS